MLAWLRDHHGIVTATELTALGVSIRHRHALVRAEVLTAVHPGVYRIGSQPVTGESRCAAICAIHPKGFVTGPTGGRLFGLRRMPNDDLIHFCAPHGLGRIDGEGVRLRQSRLIMPTDIQRRADGIRIASPWRLAFDLAADLSAADHASVIEQILQRGLCQFVTLAETARRLARPARPGSARFVATLADRVPGGPLESDHEVRLAKALRARGIPVMAQSTWLDLPNGSKARVDLSVANVRWGIEVDVHPDHLLEQGTTNDKRRDRQARLLGWQIERVTQLDLLDLDSLVSELAELYRLRCIEIGRLNRASG